MLFRNLRLAVACIALANSAVALSQVSSSLMPPDQPASEPRTRAEAGDAQAQTALGLAYSEGRGVPKDDAEAVQWFRRAAKHGDPAAQYYIGVCYASGLGVKADSEEAAKWWRKAEKAEPRARARLGALYWNGEGVERDVKKAFQLTSSAAQDGNRAAMFGFGMMYEKGEGVAHDVDAAIRWYTKAGESGELQAWNNLSFLLATSPDTKVRDTHRAVEAALKAVGESPEKNPVFLDTLARAYFENGQYGEAAETEKKALVLAPTDPVYSNLVRDYEDVENGKKKAHEVFAVERVGVGVTPPRAIYSPDPAGIAGIREATVVLWVVVGPDGRVRDLRVVRSGGKKLDDATLATVRQWRFDPARKDGKPVAVQINVEVHVRTY
jgi:TonB family protein